MVRLKFRPPASLGNRADLMTNTIIQDAARVKILPVDEAAS
jgi:hypothetical protein